MARKPVGPVADSAAAEAAAEPRLALVELAPEGRGPSEVATTVVRGFVLQRMRPEQEDAAEQSAVVH